MEPGRWFLGLRFVSVVELEDKERNFAQLEKGEEGTPVFQYFLSESRKFPLTQKVSMISQ